MNDIIIIHRYSLTLILRNPFVNWWMDIWSIAYPLGHPIGGGNFLVTG